MDVELPDGTIIEGVPEGTTKSQLMAKLKAGGYDVSKLMPSKPADESGKFRFASPETEKAGLGLIEQATEAAVKYLGEPFDVAMSKTPDTARLSNLLGNISPDVMEISQGFTPESLGAFGRAAYNQPLETAAAMGSGIAQGIGGFLADPVGTFERRPVSTIMGLQAAQLARAPGRVAANLLAEKVYPKARAALSPKNRFLAETFNEPGLQAALQEAPEGFTVPQAIAEVNAPQAQATIAKGMSLVPEQTRAAQMAQEEARIAAIRKIAGTPEQLEEAKAARGKAATENYRAAFKQAAPNIPDEFFSRPSVKAAAKVADLIEAETGRASSDMERLHNLKTGLDRVALNPSQHELPGMEKAIKSTRADLIDYLNTVPEYNRARIEFSQQSVPINQMQVGQELEKSLTDVVTEGATRGGMFARAVKDAAKTIKRATGEPYYKKLEEIYPPEVMDVIYDVKDQFRRTKLAEEQAQLGAAAAPGVEELASAKITPFTNIPFLNRTWTIANTIIKKTLGHVDQKTATELGILFQDQPELNRAIAEANKWVRETKKGSEKLKARRQRITRVTPTEGVSGAVSILNAMAPENRNAMAR